MPRFFEANEDAGAVGVKMLDGHGRVFEGIKTCFSFSRYFFVQIIWLCQVISKVKNFSEYHLGYLDENKNHEVMYWQVHL
jgi:hypothetical protein